MTTQANAEVLAFYRELPFNMWGSDGDHVAAVRSGVSLRNQPPLDALLEPSHSVLEVGCGVGWMSCQIAQAYGCHVMGIDFNPVVVDVARRTAAAMNLSAQFEAADLFAYVPAAPADVCVSLGVLHHTNDCHEALLRCATEFIRPGGHFYVGLYHAHGRRPFLDHFSDLVARGATEAARVAEFARLRGMATDDTHLYSWYRDQVIHPHETQHTLAEILDVLAPVGVELLSTSVNRFETIDSVKHVLALEPALESTGRRWLAEGRYYPGFFTAMFRRVGS